MTRLLVALGLLAGCWLIGAIVGASSAGADPLSDSSGSDGGSCPALGAACSLSGTDYTPASTGHPQSAELPDVTAAANTVTGAAQSVARHATAPHTTVRQLVDTAPATVNRVLTTARSTVDQTLSSTAEITNHVVAAPLLGTARSSSSHAPKAASPAKPRTVASEPAHPEHPAETSPAMPIAAPRAGPSLRTAVSAAHSDSDDVSAPPANAPSCAPPAPGPVGDGTSSEQASVGGVAAMVVNAGRASPRAAGRPERARPPRQPRSMADPPTVFPD